MKLKLFETLASSIGMRQKRGKFNTLSSGRTTRNLKALGSGILMWTSHDVSSMLSIVIIRTSLRRNLLFDKWQVNGCDELATSSLARHRRGRRSSRGGNVMNHVTTPYSSSRTPLRYLLFWFDRRSATHPCRDPDSAYSDVPYPYDRSVPARSCLQ